MSIRKFPFVQDEYYHIYNRGNSKQTIFHDKVDYQRFISLLFVANSIENFRLSELKDPFSINRGELLVSIGAYCLMPNHFHILIKQELDNGVSRFMQKVMTGYAMYYNKRYERTGSLYEGKFKSEFIDNDNYLKYIFSYIHLNPAKLINSRWKEAGFKTKSEQEKALDFLDQYKYSSFDDYLNKNRQEKKILAKNSFPDYFESSKKFREEIIEWLSYQPQGKAS